MSGNLDFSSSDPRLNIGMVTKKLPLAAFKQLWPAMVTPAVRTRRTGRGSSRHSQ